MGAMLRQICSLPAPIGSCTFRQEEPRLNGSCDDIVTLTGDVKGSNVSFAIPSKDAAQWTTTFTGTSNDAGRLWLERFNSPTNAGASGLQSNLEPVEPGLKPS
jgi:hypothetical protein